MKIQAKFDHYNINVLHLQRSIDFYEKALGITEVQRITAPDNSFIIVYLTNPHSDFKLELTWLKERTQPYNMGDNEQHLCVKIATNYQETWQYHRAMGWICYENTEMGLYFIVDPDGYWIEVLPE